jgi:hypothetical protein
MTEPDSSSQPTDWDGTEVVVRDRMLLKCAKVLIVRSLCKKISDHLVVIDIPQSSTLPVVLVRFSFVEESGKHTFRTAPAIHTALCSAHSNGLEAVAAEASDATRTVHRPDQ